MNEHLLIQGKGEGVEWVPSDDGVGVPVYENSIIILS
jgi:hypothetical protein